MKLYKVSVHMGYSTSDYLVLANDEAQASKYTMQMYHEWYITECVYVSNIELIAEEGQYAKPSVLLNAIPSELVHGEIEDIVERVIDAEDIRILLPTKESKCNFADVVATAIIEETK